MLKSLLILVLLAVTANLADAKFKFGGCPSTLQLNSMMSQYATQWLAMQMGNIVAKQDAVYYHFARSATNAFWSGEYCIGDKLDYDNLSGPSYSITRTYKDLFQEEKTVDGTFTIEQLESDPSFFKMTQNLDGKTRTVYIIYGDGGFAVEYRCDNWFLFHFEYVSILTPAKEVSQASYNQFLEAMKTASPWDAVDELEIEDNCGYKLV